MKARAALIASLAVLLVNAGVSQQASQPESLSSLRQRAERGDAKAQLELGMAYEDGRGVERDEAEAIRWYKRSAELGNSEAANRVAIAYHAGRGVTQDWAEAAHWYRCPAPAKTVLDSCRDVVFEDLPDGLKSLLKRMKCDALPPSTYDYGVAVDLNGDGTPEYQFCCGEARHGPCSARLFGKIGSTWRDITPTNTGFQGFTSTCGGMIVLESSHNGFRDICLPAECSTLTPGKCVSPAVWQFKNGHYVETQYTPVPK
jgi:hypothetical protein